MACFDIYVEVYGLKFKRQILGTRDKYTDEELSELEKEIAATVKELLNDMGVVRNYLK